MSANIGDFLTDVAASALGVPGWRQRNVEMETQRQALQQEALAAATKAADAFGGVDTQGGKQAFLQTLTDLGRPDLAQQWEGVNADVTERQLSQRETQARIENVVAGTKHTQVATTTAEQMRAGQVKGQELQNAAMEAGTEATKERTLTENQLRPGEVQAQQQALDLNKIKAVLASLDQADKFALAAWQLWHGGVRESLRCLRYTGGPRAASQSAIPVPQSQRGSTANPANAARGRHPQVRRRRAWGCNGDFPRGQAGRVGPVHAPSRAGAVCGARMSRSPSRPRTGRRTQRPPHQLRRAPRSLRQLPAVRRAPQRQRPLPRHKSPRPRCSVGRPGHSVGLTLCPRAPSPHRTHPGP